MGLDYTRQDVRAIRDAIAAEVPDARFDEHGDYGYRLGVAHPTKPMAWKLFQTDYNLDNDGNVIGEVVVTAFTRLEDVPKIVELLRS